MGVQLFENSNIFQWHLTESDQFSVKFMYLDLVHGPIGDFKKYLEDQSFTKNQNFSTDSTWPRTKNISCKVDIALYHGDQNPA
jgi:hypothetical protein